MRWTLFVLGSFFHRWKLIPLRQCPCETRHGQTKSLELWLQTKKNGFTSGTLILNSSFEAIMPYLSLGVFLGNMGNNTSFTV